MATQQNRKTPGYRRQKARTGDRAFVELDGQRIYLGPYDAPQSRNRYDQIIAEWLANGRRLRIDPQQLTVVELCEQFWSHAKIHYRGSDDKPTSSLLAFKGLLTRLRRLYGLTLVRDFGPVALRAVRQTLVNDDWSRGTINQAVRMIRHIFRWGVAQQLVPVAVHTALTCLPPLQKGRGEARETAKVRPVPDAAVAAVRPFLSRQIDTMIQLQLLCGSRPDEVTRLRPIDIDMSQDVWIANLDRHKTDYLDMDKIILLGPKAQQLIQPFLSGRRLDAFLFSPAEADAERRAILNRARKTPLNCGNCPGSNRSDQPKRQPGDRYTTCSYRRAIHRACDEAFPAPAELARLQVKGVHTTRWETDVEYRRRLGSERWAQLQRWRKKHRWSPNRLRHNAATRFRHLFGVDVAQSIIGHAMGSDITAAVYAEASMEKAKAAIRQVG